MSNTGTSDKWTTKPAGSTSRGFSTPSCGPREPRRRARAICSWWSIRRPIPKSGHAENLLVGEEYLRSIGAEFYHIDRGGDITFHGPGQIVGYPILDLERIGLSLRDYIDALEGAVIRTVARYGIRAGRIAGASGVWIEGAQPARKICAIGVRASRYVTMHGFALNVATDLRYFTHINPCGFTDRGATSIEKEIGRPVPMEEVKRRLVEDLCENLNVKIYK